MYAHETSNNLEADYIHLKTDKIYIEICTKKLPNIKQNSKFAHNIGERTFYTGQKDE